MRPVGVPLDVRPIAAATRDVIAQRRAVLIGRHLQPNDTRRGATEVDDHTLDHRDNAVAGQWVLPGAKLGVANLRRDEIHVADAPLVLLKCRDLPGIRGPHENGAIAVRPTGVVGGIAEVLDAVVRELCLMTGRDIAHPEIPVANERAELAVGRHRLGRPARSSASATATTATTTTGGVRSFASVDGRA